VIPSPAEVEESKCADFRGASQLEVTHEANLPQMTPSNNMVEITFTPSMQPQIQY
jgi:hypothetical protein